MKKVYLILFLLILFPISTKAVYEITDSRCTSELKLSLKEQANAITYRLSRYEENNQNFYKAFILNTQNDITLTDSNGVSIKNAIDKIKEGTKITILMKASNKNYCNGYKLGSFIINAPYYNEYSTSELCVGYEDYYLCDKNSNINLSEDEFENQMKFHILEKKQENIDINPLEKEKDGVFDYVISNYINFIIAAGLIIIYIIIARINRNHINDDLFLK